MSTISKYLPSHLQIETVNRLCNARCPMCPIKFVPDFAPVAEDPESHSGFSRIAEIMPLDRFKKIVDKFEKYKEKIKFISLHGCGEPLLDKSLSDKVAYARSLGFKNVGFTSNCDALTESNSRKLLLAGLTCLIPSIDGHTKETHEKIRPGTNFERVVNNVNKFIEIRNELDLNCKIVVRMVKQKENEAEWDLYKTYWSSRLNPLFGDVCVDFEIHNTGGKVENYEEKKLSDIEQGAKEFLLSRHIAPSTYTEINNLGLVLNEETSLVQVDAGPLEQKFLCPDLFTRLSIFASGRIALCSADQAEYHPIGNILDFTDIVDAFNSEYFQSYREKWVARNISALKNCAKCTIVVSRHLKH